MRVTLSYLLAKASCQFFGTEWTQKQWTKDTVHFMLERRSEEIKRIYVDEPFLSTELTLSTAEPRQKFQVHPFPALLALGIILIEIELCAPIESFRQSDHLSIDGQPHANTDHLAAKYVFANEALWKSRRRDSYVDVRTAIQACLEAESFMPQTDDINALRAAIDKKIVDPLKRLYNSWAIGDPIRPVEIEFADNRASMTPRRMPLPMTHNGDMDLPRMSSLRLSPTPSRPPVLGAIRSIMTSESWFKQFERLNYVLRAKGGEKSETSSSVRVAFLDSGVDQDLRSSLYAYYDFTENTNLSGQYTAHLTGAIRLFRRICDCADLYVGRVFEGPTANDRTADYMKKV